MKNEPNTTTAIANVKLELLRPGPAHNQLLSPLTPYIALCGADGPVTVHLPFEHRQLLMRLWRLRYPKDKDPATDEQRQGEIRDIGETIGQVMGQVPALLAQLAYVSTGKGELIHLCVALSGFELGMIPFESAISPDGFPGSGSPLFLQTRIPIAITREIRRGRALPVNWDRPPRILFAYAAPNGLYVPAQAHLQALREAIEPWIPIKDDKRERLAAVKKLLTIIPDASLEKIRKACVDNEYTHVHILAHGAQFKNAGEEHYGMALCNKTDLSADIVDGERLAIALTSRDSSGVARYCPTVVTLATCDSGAIDTVVAPGGSIAHELSAAGIPWVIASQFPLWMKASAIAAEVLYHGLLKGNDPRWVLYELRQRLRTESPGTHDWASIVAYSTVPGDFEQQVRNFRDYQTRERLNVMFDRLDELVGVNKVTDLEPNKVAVTDQQKITELSDLAEKIRGEFKKWLGDPDEKACTQVYTERLRLNATSEFNKCLTEPDAKASAQVYADRLGLYAASEKRIGIAFGLAKKDDCTKQAYESSRDLYSKAMKADPNNYWAITQHLSLHAILNWIYHSKLPDDHRELWRQAFQIAKWQSSHADAENKVGVLSCLAELVLLGIVYDKPDESDPKKAEKDIKEYCKEIRKLVVDEEDFALLSTKRQFRRYLTFWHNHKWKHLAKAALEALGDKLD